MTAVIDLQPERIEAAVELIDPLFRNTPQFVEQRLAAALGRHVVVKVETLNPIGSFKARGASVLARRLDPERTWVCATGGNFGQGLASTARGHMRLRGYRPRGARSSSTNATPQRIAPRLLDLSTSRRLDFYGPVLTTPFENNAQRAAAMTPMKRRMSRSISQMSGPRRAWDGGAATAGAGARSSG